MGKAIRFVTNGCLVVVIGLLAVFITTACQTTQVKPVVETCLVVDARFGYEQAKLGYYYAGGWATGNRDSLLSAYAHTDGPTRPQKILLFRRGDATSDFDMTLFTPTGDTCSIPNGPSYNVYINAPISANTPAGNPT